MGGKASKAAGKRGESSATAYLEARGWLPVDKETQGLAGDDLFMCDPKGTYWSIEVKNCANASLLWLAQAKRQATERYEATRTALADKTSLTSRLNVSFEKKNWLLMWHPKGWGFTADTWIVVKSGRLEIWE